MFDPLASWPDSMGNGRVVDPPLAVIVDLASLFPLGPGLSNNQPLKITKGGLLLTGYATGELLAWARSSTCIPNFSKGTGYMNQCKDSTVSMSGGRPGACSSHGGEAVPVTG